MERFYIPKFIMYAIRQTEIELLFFNKLIPILLFTMQLLKLF